MQKIKSKKLLSGETALLVLILIVAVSPILFSGCSNSVAVPVAANLKSGDAQPPKNDAAAQEAEQAKDPLQRLIDGNKRFMSGKSIFPDMDSTRRDNLKTTQHPFAVILGCSDSRVPPEIVFDQGLGDLFVVRVAGNVFDDAVDGSLEYAVEHLGSTLIVVMGHERCGAVTAAVENNQEAHIKTLAQLIRPAIDEAITKPGDKIENAVRANAQYVVEQIKKNEPILAKKIAENKLRVVAAYYDLDNNEVTFAP